MAKVQKIGPYSAYAIAVKYGYKGTEEEWVKEQEANRKAAEAAAAAAAESARQAAASAEQTAGAAANVDDAKNSAVKAVKNEGTVQQSAVASAGTSAVQNVKNQEAQSTSAVQSAGTTYLEQIKSAGAAQVQTVKDEGAAQTSALDEAAAAHKTELEAIASHPPQPNTETGKWQVWNAETGAYQDTDALYQGGYYTASVSDDGTLTWQGSQEGMPELPSVNIKGPKGDKGDPGLGVPSPTVSDAGKVPAVNAEGTGYELSGPYAPLSAAIRPTASGNPVSITDSVEWSLQGLKVYGKSTQVTTTGAQLFRIDLAASSQGMTVTHNEDGTINVTGTPNAQYENILNFQTTLPAGTYYLSTNGSINAGQLQPQIRINIPNTASKYYWAGPFTLEDTSSVSMMIQYRSAELVNTNISNFFVMLNTGSTALPYEPYTSGKPSPSPEYPQPITNVGANGSIALTISDGADQSQSHPISTPNGLPGIPVESGGNYTDTSGQQSACDVKDYGTGKYTQMVGHIESYNGENITTPYMSTTGQLSTGAEVYYVLDEPVVTDISADELTAYRALHTYDGSTVVSIAEDVAGLEVRYVADAQKYIDDRLAAAESHIQEIAAAQLNAQTGG